LGVCIVVWGLYNSWVLASTFLANPVGAMELHLRRRLDKWATMVTHPGHRTARACRVMEVLSRIGTPRIQAAYLRTICNGWCTRHRFQGQGPCAFGCESGSDKLVHYACCTKVDALLGSHLQLSRSPGHRELDDFLCMGEVRDEKIRDRALGLYALYRLFNGVRLNRFSAEEHSDAFKRFLKEGLR